MYGTFHEKIWIDYIEEGHKSRKKLITNSEWWKNASHPKLMYDLPIVLVELISIFCPTKTFVNLVSS